MTLCSRPAACLSLSVAMAGQSEALFTYTTATPAMLDGDLQPIAGSMTHGAVAGPQPWSLAAAAISPIPCSGSLANSSHPAPRTSPVRRTASCCALTRAAACVQHAIIPTPAILHHRLPCLLADCLHVRMFRQRCNLAMGSDKVARRDVQSLLYFETSSQISRMTLEVNLADLHGFSP